MLRLFSALIILVVLSTGCGDDESTVFLNYDSDNNSAPILAAGEYTAAARFPASSLTANIGKQITAIDYYILDLPAECRVQVYGQGSATEPGSLLYDENVTLDVNGSSWNNHTLSTPITIGEEDIWIAINVVQEFESRTVGCDVGPADENGDMFNDASGQWTTLRNFSTPIISINWNIRAVVSD